MRLNRRGFIAGSIASSAIGFGTARAQGNELLLGYLTANSGPFSSLARTNRMAAQIALDQINAAGGVNGRPVRIVEFDTAGKPEQAVLGVRALAADKNVMAIIGPFSSSECQVAFPQGQRQEICTMSMAASAPGLSAPYSFAFRNNMNEGIMVGRVLQTMKEKGLPASTASIAHATDDAVSVSLGTQVFPAIFKREGIPVRAVVDFKLSAFDLASQISKLVSDPTDVVAIGAPPEPAIRLVKELRRQGHPGRLISGATIFDITLPEKMGADGEGTLVPTTFWWQLDDTAKAFSTEFEKRAKAEGFERTRPAQFDAATHSIVEMYCQAMAETKSTGEVSRLPIERAAIRDFLQNMPARNGLEGPVKFDANRDAVKSVYVMEVMGSQWSLLQAHRVS